MYTYTSVHCAQYKIDTVELTEMRNEKPIQAVLISWVFSTLQYIGQMCENVYCYDYKYCIIFLGKRTARMTEPVNIILCFRLMSSVCVVQG